MIARIQDKGTNRRLAEEDFLLIAVRVVPLPIAITIYRIVATERDFKGVFE